MKCLLALIAIIIIAVYTQDGRPSAAAQPATTAGDDDFMLINKDFRDPACVLDDFHDAAAKADFARYFAHWTPQSVFLGTDATERWVGDEFRNFAHPYFETGRGWTYSPKGRKLSKVGEEIIYFDELLDHATYGVCRGSGVLHMHGGEWRIMQYNLSIPIPNDKAAEVVKLIQSK